MWMGRGDGSIQPITEICEVTERMELCQGDHPPFLLRRFPAHQRLALFYIQGKLQTLP